MLLGIPLTQSSPLPPSSSLQRSMVNFMNIFRLFVGGTLLTTEQKRKVVEWIPWKRFTLLYKMERDGFSLHDFHDKCDHKGPTLTVVKSSNHSLFGGYLSRPWDSSGGYKEDPEAFVFTLKNPHDIPPTQYLINPTDVQRAYFGGPTWCAAFGYGDLRIQGDSHTKNSAYSFFPKSYVDTTGKGNKTFAGEDYFSIVDLEVYEVI